MTTSSDTALLDTQPLASYDLGVVPYLLVQQLQSHLRHAVAERRTQGVLLLLEHHPVVTLGAHAPPSDLLNPVETGRRGLEVVRSERGGRTTIHVPGQLIAYPVIRIPDRDLRAYVHDLEEVLVRVLESCDVQAQRIPSRPGLYVNSQKIASVGLRCEHGIASHGSALNVDLDLAVFDLITSCGEPGMRQTSMAAIVGRSPSLSNLKTTYLEAFEQVFQRPLTGLRETTCEQLLARLAEAESP